MHLNLFQEGKLQRLRTAFRARLPERVRAIQATAEVAFGAHETPERARRSLERLLHQAHRLHGSSAILGFPAVSQTAHGLEEALRGLLEGDARQASRAALLAIRGLEALKGALGREGLAGPLPNDPPPARRRTAGCDAP